MLLCCKFTSCHNIMLFVLTQITFFPAKFMTNSMSAEIRKWLVMSLCTVWLLHSLPRDPGLCYGSVIEWGPGAGRERHIFTPLLYELYSTFTPPTRGITRGGQAMLASRIKVEGKHFKSKKSTRRYSPLHGLSSSSCRGLWPSAEAFFFSFV